MNFKQFAPVMILVSLVALAIAGCSDGESDPTSPPPAITMDTEMAEDWTGQVLSMVSGMAVDVPDLVAGDFSGDKSFATDGGEPQWDVEQQAYVYTYNGPLMELEPPNSWIVRVRVWIQYRDAQGPVRLPILATEVEVQETLGMTMHLVNEDQVSDIDYDFETAMVVADIGSGDSFSVVGSGSSEVYATEHTGDTSRGGRFEMDWAMNLAVYEGGCPSGTANVNAPGWEMDATYDGAGTVDWVLTGDGGQASGTEAVDCTPGEA